MDPCSSRQETGCQETGAGSSLVQTWAQASSARGTPGLESAWLVHNTSHKYGVDYSETFALVANFTTISLVQALGCKSNWNLLGTMVKTVFHNSELKEIVYMEISKGVMVPTNKNLVLATCEH